MSAVAVYANILADATVMEPDEIFNASAETLNSRVESRPASSLELVLTAFRRLGKASNPLWT